MFEVKSVESIRYTTEVGLLQVNGVFNINGTDQTVVDYGFRESDPHGVAPAIKAWIEAHSDFPIDPHMPPTDEEIRSTLPDLTARQFRLGMVRAGISLSAINGVIEQMPAGPEKDMAQIEWEYATTFSRMHPLVGSISGALGLTAVQVDEMWTAGLD